MSVAATLCLSDALLPRLAPGWRHQCVGSLQGVQELGQGQQAEGLLQLPEGQTCSCRPDLPPDQ